ncbi:hypothetical protein [Mesorhizobium sp. 113-3-3]|nr:hypothetical protein [Mesorhizobium sp. 113-3-3]BCG83355.1 hypothetical protein MesoLj113b_68970 [Mesorhizobium sp. 113-3-3]
MTRKTKIELGTPVGATGSRLLCGNAPEHVDEPDISAMVDALFEVMGKA